MKRINFRSGLFQAVLLMSLPFFLQAQVENNAKIVYDACDNSLMLRGPDGNPRKSFFIRQNEVITFEINNANPLRYHYTLNHSLEAFHVDFSRFEKVGGEVIEDTSMAEKSFSDSKDCKESIMTLLIIISETSFKKAEVSSNECIPKESIMTYLDSVWSEVSNIFPGVSIQNLTDDVEKLIKKGTCGNPSNLEPWITYDTNNKPIGLRQDFRKQIDAFLTDFTELLRFAQGNMIRSIPLYTKGQNIDLIRYSLKKEPMDKNDLSGKELEATYDIEIRRGFKIDVSAGLFLTGLVDEKYYLADEGDSLKTIKDEKTDQYSISIGSTVNMNWRLGCSMSGGFSLGVAFPFTNDSKIPQIMAGLDYIVGREWRLGIVGGVVYGPTSVLKQGYKSGSSYAITDNTVPMTEISKISYFFGLVYNLGSEKILGKNP